MAWIRWATVSAFVAATGGCFGGGNNDDDEGGGTCEQHSGTWLLSGTCAATSCTVNQSGCTFTMNCDDQTTFNGSFNGNSLTFTNAESSCSGTVTTSGAQVTGTCNTSGETCNYTGQCSSGNCSTGSGGFIDPVCENGTNGVCSCLVGSAEECTDADAQLLYDGCVMGLPEADFVACFADYVDVAAGTVDCPTAADACIPAMP